MHRSHDRADVHGLVQRIAHPERLHPDLQLFHQPVRDAFLRKDPGSGAAHLSLVEPDRVHHAFDHGIEIRVIVHEKRRLAAQLERQLLSASGCHFPDDPSDLRRTGKRDLVHVRLLDERGSRAAVPGDHVEHAGRKTDSGGEFGEGERRERCELGGLEDDGVPGGEGGRDLPREHQQREIPRDDLPHDPDRYLAGHLPLEQLCPACVVIEVPHDERDVDVPRLADRLPVVQGFQYGKQPGFPLQATGDRIQVAGAAVSREPAPGWKCQSRRGHGGFHVRRASLCDPGQGPAGRRVHRLETCSVRRVVPGAPDPVREIPPVLLEPGIDGARRLGRGTVFEGLEDLRDLVHRFLLRTTGLECAYPPKIEPAVTVAKIVSGAAQSWPKTTIGVVTGRLRSPVRGFFTWTPSR